MSDFLPTRESGLARLEQFALRAGTDYKTRRDFDLGADKRNNVSGLSPYLTHRLITESEVVQAVLAAQKPTEAEPFLQELCRRTYWKGWLEGRPQVYANWRRLLQEDSRRWPERDDYQRAVAGETGIDAFDGWVKELKSEGYLHTNARMSFASIWIFTLRLPWSLGAAFFMRHLLDGDVASNSLSWRWVAGLHTKGKNYVATAAGIKQFTGERFDPTGCLAEKPAPLTGPPNPPYSPPIDYPFQVSEQVGEEYALLLTGDDLCPEIGVTSEMKPKLVVSARVEDLDTGWQFSEEVMSFKSGALADARQRAESHFGCPSAALSTEDDPAGSLGTLMKQNGLTSLVYYEPFVGPWKGLTAKLSSRDVGVKFFPLRRPWDGLLHPHAVKGYFHFRKHVLPQVLRSKGKI